MTNPEYRIKLLADQQQSRDHAEMFLKRRDMVNYQRKLEQAKQFYDVIRFFDAWKPKAKVKKENDNEPR